MTKEITNRMIITIILIKNNNKIMIIIKDKEYIDIKLDGQSTRKKEWGELNCIGKFLGCFKNYIII